MVGGRMLLVGSRGRCRGGTGGRSSLLDGGVRLIFEGLATSRPGIGRGSLSSVGRGRRVPVADSRQREPRATVLDLGWCSCSPRQRPGAIVVVVRSVKGGGLPEECGEFAGDRDRDDAGGLAALVVQALPALVQSSLGAPGDLDHARVLAGLWRRASVSVIAGCLR